MRRAIPLLAGILLSGVVHALDWVGVPEDGQTTRRNLDQMMQQYPLGANENIRFTRLSSDGLSTNLLMQVRGREPLHHDADSDITMFLLRGQGTIRIGDRSFPVKAGDVLHIPRGVPHGFVNQGSGIGIALLVLSPSPGPNDQVLDESAAR